MDTMSVVRIATTLLPSTCSGDVPASRRARSAMPPSGAPLRPWMVGLLRESTFTGGHHDGPDAVQPHPQLHPHEAGVAHSDAVSEASLHLPRWIDDPATAEQLARDLLRCHREDITLALYLDDQHRLVGTAMVAVGWAQHARLSVRPILSGAQACRATSCLLLFRYGRYRSRTATEAELRSFGILAAACRRHGLPVVDHLVVTATDRSAPAP